MKKCELCGLSEPALYRSEDGYKVCSSCAEKLRKHVCIVCGCDISDDTHSLKGTCTSCMQIIQFKMERIREEELAGLSPKALSELTQDVKFTDEDYYNWIGDFIKKYEDGMARRVAAETGGQAVVENSGLAVETSEQCDDESNAVMSKSKIKKLRNILFKKTGWSLENFKSNIKTIDTLIKSKDFDVFDENIKLIYFDSTTKLVGLNIIYQSGNILVSKSEAV